MISEQLWPMLEGKFLPGFIVVQKLSNFAWEKQAYKRTTGWYFIKFYVQKHHEPILKMEDKD